MYILVLGIHKYICLSTIFYLNFSYLFIPTHSSDTGPDAVFAGSMQLLAGVKLCTGRTITNHPHFENKLLRERTVQVVFDTITYCISA